MMPKVIPVAYTNKEGGEWLDWPFPSHGPSTTELLVHIPGKSHAALRCLGNPKILVVAHALKFDDGSAWDSFNGYRDE